MPCPFLGKGMLRLSRLDQGMKRPRRNSRNSKTLQPKSLPNSLPLLPTHGSPPAGCRGNLYLVDLLFSSAIALDVNSTLSLA